MRNKPIGICTVVNALAIGNLVHHQKLFLFSKLEFASQKERGLLKDMLEILLRS